MQIEDLAEAIEQLRHQFALFQQTSHSLPGESAELLFNSVAIALEKLQRAEADLEQQNQHLHMTQELLQLEQQRYRKLFDFAPDAYLVTDSQGIIQEANRAAIQILEVDYPQLLGNSLLMFVTPESWPTFHSDLLAIAPDTPRQEWTARICPHQGEAFDASLAVTISTDPVDQAPSYHWLIRDISQHTQTEQEILTLNSELVRRDIFNVTLKRVQDNVRSSLDEHQILQTVVQELGRALNLLYCDVALYDLAAQTSTIRHQYVLPGIPYLTDAPPPIAMADFATGYRQLTQGQGFQFCELTDHPLRSQVSIFACPIVDHQEVLGDLWCFTPQDTIWHDVEIHLVEQIADQCAIALRQARLYQAVHHRLIEMGKLHRLKDDFLSTISHELRTPLTTMKMALHLLRSAPGENQRSRCLDILQRECDREIDLVNDLLDLQQLELSNYRTFIPDAISLEEWVTVITAALKQKAVAHQQPFQIQFAPNLPALRTDQFSLRRLLLELLTNAQKYTPTGGEIHLEVSCSGDATKTMFTLRNQAEIPAHELPNIFHKFYRVPQEDAWKAAGTGLGLSLVKELVQHLQGTIAVDSRAGWTTFTVEIPNLASSKP